MTLKKLGRYEVLRVLGKGAMGVVYEGRDPNLDRRVAIKTVKVENLSEEAAAEYEHRFRTEARSAARLQHPNIVSVYDSDRDGDVAFLVMEFIQGDDLKHHLDRGVRYTLEQSLKIVRDLLSALDYAHKQGIVHRDVKPANLLIEPGGRVKLTDFGVARIQDSGEATRTQGSMVGTLKYMAPEQVQGQKIDARADLFSTGVVLYQLLTDKRPFDGDNDFSIIHQIIGHNPPPPSAANPRLPAALDAVVARALAKDKDERFATARDFAVALQAAIRRAEDQTVVPPANPNKRADGAASRPLTSPGTGPGGATQPSVGGISSVTQELELVYWKDVKDSADPEELTEFLQKFPAGIYADLARRRLRKLAGDATNTYSATGPATGTAPQADPDATRLRDPSVPSAMAGGRAGTSADEDVFPSTQASAQPEDLQPTQWIDEEYTRTLAQPAGFMAAGEAALAAAGAAAAGRAPAAATPVAAPVAAPAASAAPSASPAPAAAEKAAPASAGATATAATAATAAPAAAAPAAPRPASANAQPPQARPAPAPAAEQKKKVPVAAIAGIAVLALAGVLALVLRGGDKPADAVMDAPSSGPAATAAVPPVPPAAAAPMAAPAPADAVPAASAPAVAAATASAPDKAATPAATPARKPPPRSARAEPAPAPEPPRPVAATPPRAEPEPPPVRPASTPSPNAANLAAVEACKERFFLSREICLKENCARPGTRNHPLCVTYREEVRLREESKQLPQQR